MISWLSIVTLQRPTWATAPCFPIPIECKQPESSRQTITPTFWAQEQRHRKEIEQYKGTHAWARLRPWTTLQLKFKTHMGEKYYFCFMGPLKNYCHIQWRGELKPAEATADPSKTHHEASKWASLTTCGWIFSETTSQLRKFGLSGHLNCKSMDPPMTFNLGGKKRGECNWSNIILAKMQYNKMSKRFCSSSTGHP